MSTRTQHYESSGYSHFQSPINAICAPDLTRSVSVNTIPMQNDYLLNEAVRAGYRFQGNMSNVRRFFCLLVTFDVLFIGLMWLICIMLHGSNIWQAIDQQIKHYNIKTSLFDIFFLAICRFIIFWLFYGIIYINHWIIIVLTTGSTCAFTIVKVFYYDWQQTPQPVFEVLSVLISFILAWGEAWFFDYRVIPQESYANQFVIEDSDERSPLIRRYLTGVTPTPSRYSESMDNFHSPMNSPQGSIYKLEDDESCACAAVTIRYPPADLSPKELEKYEALAQEITEESKGLFSSDEWTLERENDEAIAHSKHIQSGQKIFKVTATINTSPTNVFIELYHEIESMPSWNTSLLEAQRIQILNEHTDIIYQLSASGAGGLVSSRDFVSVRCWTHIDNISYLIATKAAEHPNVPKNSKYVRGEAGVTCILLEPGENDNQCRMEFILNTNLKGWIPQTVVDLALVDSLFDYVNCLKIHVDKKYQSGNEGF